MRNGRLANKRNLLQFSLSLSLFLFHLERVPILYRVPRNSRAPQNGAQLAVPYGFVLPELSLARRTLSRYRSTHRRYEASLCVVGAIMHEFCPEGRSRALTRYRNCSRESYVIMAR